MLLCQPPAKGDQRGVQLSNGGYQPRLSPFTRSTPTPNWSRFQYSIERRGPLVKMDLPLPGEWLRYASGFPTRISAQS